MTISNKNKRSLVLLSVLISFLKVHVLFAAVLEVPVESGRYRTNDNLFVFGSSYADRYRIPSLIKLNNGDKLFFAERRPYVARTHDFKEQSIKMRRLRNDGTLENEIFVHKQSDIVSSLSGDYSHNLMNPTTVYDPNANVVHLFYQDIITFRDSSTIYQIQNLYSTSSDSGENWTEPRNVTTEFTDQCEAVIVGPGSAVRISDGPFTGRLVVPLHTHDFPSFNYTGSCTEEQKVATGYFKAAYSDDNGVTWQQSNRLSDGSSQAGYNETQIIYLDNTLYMFSRLEGDFEYDGSGLGYSIDGGVTWLKGFNENGPVTDNNDLIGVTGRFVTPTQSSLATDGEHLYYTTSVYYSSDESISNRKEAWLHKFKPNEMSSKTNSPINYVQPITKSGFSNVSTMYLGDHKIGILWEEVKTWQAVKRIWNIYYTELDTRDFRHISDPDWTDNGFIYHPTWNGSHHLLNQDILMGDHRSEWQP
jgi:hypothetical protein